jgi:diguanylate cyclase (GGDEF)-like protein/PAS domain S-box-containing protein
MEMREENKTKRQLINELKHLRRRIAELEADRKQDGERLSKDRGHPEESVNERIACTEEPQEELIQHERAEEKIRRLARAVEQSPAPVVITDSNGNIEYVNSKFAQLTGYTYAEAIGRNPRILKSGKQPPELYEELWQTISNGKEWRGEFLNKKKNGDLYWENASISAIKNEEGVITHFVGVKEDITERKQEEETMRQLAYHDPLTGLPNRLLFKDRLTIALAQANRNRQKLAVMLLDLDHFKDINDTLGHSVGDQLLKAVGKRLIGLLRKNDTVARMGGDEFLILLPEMKKLEDASTIAQRVMGTVRKPCVINGHKLRMTASIGVAVYPDDGQDDDSLMNHADNAMYWAKNEGRDTYHR